MHSSLDVAIQTESQDKPQDVEMGDAAGEKVYGPEEKDVEMQIHEIADEIEELGIYYDE